MRLPVLCVTVLCMCVTCCNAQTKNAARVYLKDSCPQSLYGISRNDKTW
jgi:hypothetical protein